MPISNIAHFAIHDSYIKYVCLLSNKQEISYFSLEEEEEERISFIFSPTTNGKMKNSTAV